MKSQPDPDRIAAEAVGQTHSSAPPDWVREKERMSPEETARRNARSAGAHASISEKTAESVGERVGDAYSNSPSDRVFRAAGRQAGSQGRSVTNKGLDPQPVLTALAGFGLGYLAGALIYRRRQAD